MEYEKDNLDEQGLSQDKQIREFQIKVKELQKGRFEQKKKLIELQAEVDSVRNQNKIKETHNSQWRERCEKI